MRTYKDFRPTGFDSKGLGLEDRQDWLVAPCGVNRDSDDLSESNWHTMLASLRDAPSDDYEVHRFGHWACGWFEIVIVRPDSEAERIATEIESALADYPVLDDEDHSRRESESADRVWRDCYTIRQRLDYIADNREQFDFRSFSDLLSCARGNYFGGYASELLH